MTPHYSLILLAALAQGPYPDLRDAAFVVAQEEWVYAAAKPLRYDGVLSGAEARLLRCLDCGHWDCRELAAARLREVPLPRRARVLFWGSKARSASVASLCRTMLDDLYRCPHCNGSGECPREGPCPLCYTSSCRECDSTGDLRHAFGWVVGGERVPSDRVFRWPAP